MKTLALLTLLVAAMVCHCQGRSADLELKQAPVAAPLTPPVAAAAPTVPRLAVDSERKDSAPGLTKERLDEYHKAIEAFNTKIDSSSMDAEHKKAIKQQVLEHVAARLRKLRN